MTKAGFALLKALVSSRLAVAQRSHSPERMQSGHKKPSPKKRFRPSSTALSGARPYQRATSPGPNLASPCIPGHATAPVASKRKKWATQDSRGGKFIRKHSGGRLATYACELTLMHLTTAFAVAAGAAGAAEASARSGNPAASTEEGDLRRALSRVLGQAPPTAASSAGVGPSKGRAPVPVPLHPMLLQPAISRCGDHC